MKNKKRKTEYCFIIKSAREEMAFAQFAVTYQHFLREELKKKRVFNFCKLVRKVADYLEKGFPESVNIPLKFKKIK